MIAAAIAVWLTCCAFTAYLIITAPLGFEGSEGFHYGNEPQTALDTPRAGTRGPGQESAGAALFDHLNHGEHNG